MIYGYAIGGGGGGKSGATLTVTAPVGSTVTVSKGAESYSSGLLPAVFKGLSSGTWVIDYTNGPQVGQATINIAADYAITVTYFAATINISYPAGSTCTVSKGGTTLTAPNTSGTWVCTVPEAGTWTVTATDGTNEKSQTVEITQSGQSVAVTLSYRLYLFEPGNQHTDITGGWTASQMGSITEEKISLIANYAAHECVAYTNNVIDLTGYTTINFFFPSVRTPQYGYAGAANWGVADTNAGAFLVKGGLLAKNTVTNQQYTVDLGTVSGGRPKMQTLAGDEGNATSLECSHVWLE